MREARQIRFDNCRDGQMEGVEMPSLDKVKYGFYMLQQLFIEIIPYFRHF